VILFLSVRMYERRKKTKPDFVLLLINGAALNLSSSVLSDDRNFERLKIVAYCVTL